MKRLLAAVLVVTALATGCGGDDEPGADPSTSSSTGPRPVTSEESERLAIGRFRNYQRELVPFEITVAPAAGGTVTVTGRADMRLHHAVASGTAAGAGGAPAYATFAWNLAAVGVVDTQTPATPDQLALVGKIPAAQWQVHPIDSTEPLDQAFRVLLNLALDRPDNAQLLRQNGAQWLASTVVDGKDVDVMTATPQGSGQTLSYYVADDGTIVRVDVVSQGARPSTITFLDGDATDVGTVPVVKALGPDPTAEPPADPEG